MKNMKSFLVASAGVSFVICAALFVFVSAMAQIGKNLSPTPDESSIRTKAVQTFVAPYTQTAKASVPTSVSTSTPYSLPTFEASPTITAPVISYDAVILYATESMLALRDSPSVSGGVVLRLSYNQSVTSLESRDSTLSKIGVQGQWVNVSYDGKAGYVAAWYLSVVPLTSPDLVFTPSSPSISTSHPAGTSGQCGDGSYTSANHKQGACSHHGGVSDWWGK